MRVRARGDFLAPRPDRAYLCEIMRLHRSLAVGCLLSLVIALPLAAGCESSSPSATTSTGDGGPDIDANVPSTCTPATGAGTTHSTIDGDETWTAAASPHVVDTSSTIGAGKTLTLEPCAVVQLKAGIGLLVEGKLLAQGAADKPIRIERGDSASAWSSIEARQGASLSLAYVTVEGGGFSNGGRPTQFGMLDIRGNQDVAAQPALLADHVTLKGSESLGIWLREGGGFAPGSKDLTITGGKDFPMLIWGRALRTLPSGTYTGNATDEIIIPGNGGTDDIQEDTTLADHGVPYRVGGPTGGATLVVRNTAGTIPLLTIQAGVTLRFDANGRVDLDSASDLAIGALRVEGTADKPVIFTSAKAAPAAGDWTGIVFEGLPDPRTKIAYAKISYAGGTSGISSYGCPSPGAPSFANQGAIIFAGGAPPAGAVSNTTIDNSAGEGIVRGWTGAEVDMLATNTFTGIARCNQTLPKPQNGVCPDPAPCPK